MTQRQMKPGNGILFRNERKETDNHPDYTGRCVRSEDGVECWFSAWIKEGRKGKYMTTSIGKPVAETAQQGVEQARQANGEQPAQSGGPGPETGGGDGSGDGSDIPFLHCNSVL